MSAPAILRPMAPADREAVIDLVWDLNRYEDAISGDRATERDAAAACLGANRRRVAEHGGLELVAEAGDRVVGYLCAVIEQGPAYLRPSERTQMWIAELVVAEAARRRGVGEALVAAAESDARARGLARIMIGHLVGNEGAERLYARMGYAPYVVERIKRLG